MSSVKFKSVKRKQIRKRAQSSDSDDGDDLEASSKPSEVGNLMKDLKEVQKMRKREKGVSAEALLAVIDKKEEVKVKSDPFKLKTGGCIDMKKINRSQVTMEDLEHIGTSFAAETNRRDEDADMIKYVDLEVKKRKMHHTTNAEQVTNKKQQNALDQLYQLPENLGHLVKKKEGSEDMLSNQMLSGIPEVELGIEVKIRNIEATEEAKAKLLEDRKRKMDQGLEQFVPTNMAANFVQHNRFNVEDVHPKLAKVEAPKPAPVRVGDAVRPNTELPAPPPIFKQNKKKHSGHDKATDDLHFEKFKKHMRRY